MCSRPKRVFVGRGFKKVDASLCCGGHDVTLHMKVPSTAERCCNRAAAERTFNPVELNDLALPSILKFPKLA